jgi:hypothetical protein
MDHDPLDPGEPLELLVVEGSLFGAVQEGAPDHTMHCDFIGPVWIIEEDGSVNLTRALARHRAIVDGPDGLETGALVLYRIEQNSPFSNTCHTIGFRFLHPGQETAVEVPATSTDTTFGIQIQRDSVDPSVFHIDGSSLGAGQSAWVRDNATWEGERETDKEPIVIEFTLHAQAVRQTITQQEVHW